MVMLCFIVCALPGPLDRHTQPGVRLRQNTPQDGQAEVLLNERCPVEFHMWMLIQELCQSRCKIR